MVKLLFKRATLIFLAIIWSLNFYKSLLKILHTQKKNYRFWKFHLCSLFYLIVIFPTIEKSIVIYIEIFLKCFNNSILKRSLLVYTSKVYPSKVKTHLRNQTRSLSVFMDDISRYVSTCLWFLSMIFKQRELSTYTLSYSYVAPPSLGFQRERREGLPGAEVSSGGTVFGSHWSSPVEWLALSVTFPLLSSSCDPQMFIKYKRKN